MQIELKEDVEHMIEQKATTLEVEKNVEKDVSHEVE